MTAAAAHPTDLSGFSPTARWLATFAALSAFFTSIFTGSMVNVAIPNAMGAFGVGQSQAQFLSSAFLATNTTGLLASSWLIGKIGQRPTFALVLTLFASAGVLCYVAPTFEMLIVGRVVQGFAAGVIQPLVMLVLFQVFPPERRGLAMGLFSIGVTVALGLGPSIGGIVIDAFNWRAIFLAPIPAGMTALLLGMLFLPKESQSGGAGKFDVLGFVLINIAVFCWFTMLGNGQRWGWASDQILSLAAATFIAASAFVLSQKRLSSSLMDLRLFGNGRFVTALCISFVFGFGNFASVYAFPIFGQLVQNFTPTVAGSMLLPGSLFAAAILPMTGRFADKFPAPVVMTGGMLVIAVSVAMLAGADANTLFWYVAFALLLGRVGSALVSPAMNTTAMGALTFEQVRRGAGVVSLSLMLGGSTGISVFVVMLEQRTEFHATNLGATQTSQNTMTVEMLDAVSGRLASGGLPEVVKQGAAMNYLDKVVSAQATVFAFQDGFVVLTIIALVPLFPVMLLIRRRR